MDVWRVIRLGKETFMQLTKEKFKERFERKLDDYFENDIKHASNSELCAALSAVVRDGYAPQWRRTRISETHEGNKQIYYF